MNIHLTSNFNLSIAFIHMLFYVLAGFSILSATVVVTSRHPVHGVLALVFTFFSMAGIWLLLHAEFLALILVLVYVGAVMTLFLFIVMLLPTDTIINNKTINNKTANEVSEVSYASNKPASRRVLVRYLAIISVMLIAMISLVIIGVHAKEFDLTVLPVPDGNHNTASLGSVLYTQYAYPLEIAGVLLLTAIIAAISLTYRKPTDRKIQRVHEQVSVKRNDRVKLVGGKSEC